MHILGTSVPKSGTHLLTQIFKRLGYLPVACPKKPGASIRPLLEAATVGGGKVYAYGHWRCQEPTVAHVRNLDYRVIVLIRDPRDICLSMADYIKAGNPPELHALDPDLASYPWKKLAIGAIEGFRSKSVSIPAISKVCQGWLDWQEMGAVLLRYEDIAEQVIRQEPFAQVERIGLDPSQFLKAATQSFGYKNKSLKKGQVRRWMSEFDDEMIRSWNVHARGVATLFGFPET